MSVATADLIETVVDQIFTVRRISRKNQQQLMNLLLSQTQLTSQEQDCVQRIFEGLKRGMLRVVD